MLHYIYIHKNNKTKKEMAANKQRDIL
uniref:Uncharacterized protein n=1 Tax=Anguilla anguilla TaxID=7936 RepID=A0A0E9PA40_ANGAN